MANNPFSFIYSIKNNSVQTLRDLIKERNELIFIDNDGNTVFHHIIKMDVSTQKKIELIDLINEKIDLSILEIKNKQNKSSWDCAKDMEEKEIYKHLLFIDNFCGGNIERIKDRIKDRIKYGIDMNTINKKGKTPLHMAISKDNVEIARLLLENKADVNNTDRWGNTSLHLAISGGNIEITRLLLEYKANMNKTNLIGNTPLKTAVLHKNIEITRLLLEYSAENVDKAYLYANDPEMKMLLRRYRKDSCVIL